LGFGLTADGTSSALVNVMVIAGAGTSLNYKCAVKGLELRV